MRCTSGTGSEALMGNAEKKSMPGDSVPTNSANPDGTQKLSHAAVMPDVPTGFDSKKDCSCGKNDVNDLVEAITRKVMAELKK